jgi:ribosomal protein L28
MSYLIKFPRVGQIGFRVSHAKNRTKHAFKRNLHRATIIVDGVKKKVLVPTKVLRVLKADGITTHYKKAE